MVTDMSKESLSLNTSTEMPIQSIVIHQMKTFIRLRVEAPFTFEGYERWDKSTVTNVKHKMEIKPSSPLLPYQSYVYSSLWGNQKVFLEKLNYRSNMLRENSQLKVAVRHWNKNKRLSKILPTKNYISHSSQFYFPAHVNRILTAYHLSANTKSETDFFLFTRKTEHPREKLNKYWHLGPQQNAEALPCHPEVKPLMDIRHQNTQRFQWAF